MISENIQKMIPLMQQYFLEQPIEKAWLFGSSSRGEEREDSDIDILVEYDRNAKISLFTISRIMLQMKRILGREVDLIENDCLLPFAEESANHDKILIYERKN